MRSRLRTTEPELATKINSANLADAKVMVMSILLEKLSTLPEKAVRLLPDNFEIQSHSVSQDQIDALDDRYFDSEKKGDAEDSAASFIAARFLAAVLSWQTTTDQLGLCESAYEASFAAEQSW